MRKNLFLVFRCVTLIAGLSSSMAYADTFNFTFSGVSDTGSGVMTASPTGTPGVELITGIVGTTDGSAISALLAPGSYPAPLALNDNDLYTASGSFLDIQGVSYVLANGTDINLYFGQFGTGDPTVYNLISGPDEINDGLTSFSLTQNVAATPEPGSLVLLGTGVLGLVAAAGRMLRKA